MFVFAVIYFFFSLSHSHSCLDCWILYEYFNHVQITTIRTMKYYMYVLLTFGSTERGERVSEKNKEKHTPSLEKAIKRNFASALTQCFANPSTENRNSIEFQMSRLVFLCDGYLFMQKRITFYIEMFFFLLVWILNKTWTRSLLVSHKKYTIEISTNPS